MNGKTFLIFLILNFGGLWLGSFFTTEGVSSDWYQGLNQAPWTPPGWVFGAAWTSIMVLFSFYMSFLWQKKGRKLIGIYSLAWMLNLMWNPVFFGFRQIGLGLLVLLGLSSCIYYLLLKFRTSLGSKSLFILPYALWLLVAISLNAFILFNPCLLSFFRL